MKLKYFIKTYGCQMNKADSERIAGWYESRGYMAAQNIQDADKVVINTCSVRQSAEDRVYGQINNLSKLKVKNSKLKVAVKNSKFVRPRIVLTGCMLRYPIKWLREKMPQVDEFKRIEKFTYHTPYAIHHSPTHAWVPIMEGCNNFCTYCVVPYARGREKPRPIDGVVCEVEELVKRGCKEITLLGQNVNSYGNDFTKQEIKELVSCYYDSNHSSKEIVSLFSLLLKVLHKIHGLEKIKFMTSNPWDLTDDIIDTMKLPKIDRYLHLPVQSGDDEILRRMNRRHTAKDYLNLVEKIRREIPEIEIGTDIIVGFPGESEKQFQNTVNLCQKVGFKVAYVAMYSPRPQTAAYKLRDDVPFVEKKRRWEILEELINKPKIKKPIVSQTFSSPLPSQ